MASLISHSPEDTARVGEAWGREASRGWVIGLSGDLGAGKTQLVKGLARGLGYAGRVHSPTFTLVNPYLGGRLPLLHLDLYRLSGPADIHTAGLEEFLDQPGGVTVVEWIDRWFGSSRPQPDHRPNPAGRYRHVHLSASSETRRLIDHEDFEP